MREISKKVLLFSLAATIITLLFGIWIGTIISETKFQDIEREMGLNLDRSAILLLSNNFCTLYESMKEALKKEREILGEKLDYLEKMGEYNEKLKERYFYLEYRNYLMGEKYKRECNNTMAQMLYFYKKDCEKCKTFGQKIDEIREKFNITVYAFDISKKSDIIDYIKETYTKTAPSVYFEGNIYTEKNITKLEELLSKNTDKN